jgi:hypothetical protein
MPLHDANGACRGYPEPPRRFPTRQPFNDKADNAFPNIQ